MEGNPARVHILGGPGSGKTTLARHLSDTLGVPAHHLDTVAYQAHRKRPAAERLAGAERIAATPGWIAEGVYLGWTEPLLERAEVIVWLDVPWRMAAWRIVSRHVRASLVGSNAHPGWRRLAAFLPDARAYYTGRSIPASPEDDAGISRAATERALSAYPGKVLRYRRPPPVSLAYELRARRW